MIRHGDVLLVPANREMPQGANYEYEIVLAEGELTGHAHVLTCEQGIVRWQDFVVANGPAELTHQEHGTAVLVPGQVYQVVEQVEYDLNGQWRKVQD